MYEFITSIFKSRYRLPRILFGTSIAIYNGVRKTLNKPPILPSERFFAANFGRFEKIKQVQSARFEVVYVATSKDFDVMRISIKWLLRLYRPDEISNIKIIIPENDLASCESLAEEIMNSRKGYKFEIVNENDCLDPKANEQIRAKFPHRYGWVFQQFLKLQAVLESRESSVLILDADTILLQKRNFVDQQGMQLLLPTDEYNQDYYKNLEKLSGLDVRSDYSFVSHHLLIQREFFTEIMQELKCGSINDLVEKVLATSDLTSDSPFSIDYELYSQYLLKNHPNKVRLSRWGNLSLRRSPCILKLLDSDLILIFRRFYFSLSLHSWSH
jgi:hypothetical protein